MENTKNYIQENINNNIMVVEFTTAGGEYRKMFCSLMPAMLPETKTSRKAPDSVAVVFDIQKNDWRSFCWDRVTSAQTLDEILVTHQSEYNLKLLGTRYVDALNEGVYTGTFQEYFDEYKENVEPFLEEKELISNTGR